MVPRHLFFNRIFATLRLTCKYIEKIQQLKSNIWLALSKLCLSKRRLRENVLNNVFDKFTYIRKWTATIEKDFSDQRTTDNSFFVNFWVICNFLFVFNDFNLELSWFKTVFPWTLFRVITSHKSSK